MPVDARIALGVEPVKMPDFAQLAVQRSAVMNNMAEMASKQRALNEQNTLAQLMQDPSFSFDNPESRSRVQRAAPNLGGAVLKSYDDAQAAQAEAKTKALAYADAQTTSMLGELFQYKDFGPAEEAVDQRVAAGQLTPEQGEAAKAKMRSYDKYDLFAADMARSKLTPAQMLEQEVSQLDTGAEIIDRTKLKYGRPGEGFTELGRTTKKLTPDQIADNARAAANERQQSTRPLTGVNAAGDMIVMSPDILSDPRINPTGASSVVIPGAGKPSGGFERAQAARGEAYSQISAALPVLDELLKPDSNVDKAGGGLPTVLSTAFSRAFGMTTEEMKAQAKLGPEGYVLLQQVPRFEGPQSDKDTAAYKDAAGKLTDPFSTAGEKRAALEAIKAILLRNKAYLDANPQSGAAKTAPAGGTGGVINWNDM